MRSTSAFLPLARVAMLVLVLALACDGSTEPTYEPPEGDPVPVLESITPTSVAVGADGTLITVTGRGFTTNSVVRVNGTPRATTFVDATRLTTPLLPTDVDATRALSVTVINPPPRGGLSAALVVHVRDLLTIAPRLHAVRRGEEVDLTATDAAGADVAVVWRVNGVIGGNATVGEVGGGAYLAPDVLPGDSVVLSATLVSDPTLVRTATFFFIPPGTQSDFRMALPRVLDATAPAPTRLLVLPPGNATSVRFEFAGGGTVEATYIGNGIHTVVVPASAALGTYRPGALHGFAGFLDEYDAGGTRLRRINTFLNVRDAGMPAVPITPMGTDAQRSPYLLNLRLDSATAYPDGGIVTRALQTLGSGDVDFVAVIATVTTVNNRVYLAVRNGVEGIGLSTFDNSAAWGGSSRLQGVIAYPVDGLFDAAETAMSHEIGHRWINFATHDPLLFGRPHWRPSSMASGVMGFSLATGAGGNFRWRLVPLGGGSVRAERLATSGTGVFDPLDLYLMGLLPSDSVPPRYLLPTTLDPNTLVDLQTYPAETYTVEQYIAHHGPRVPSSESAPREFAVAVVILSAGRLLSPSEMAFFDHVARRGETRVSLPSQSGFSAEDAVGFYQATGGRATLRMALP